MLNKKVFKNCIFVMLLAFMAFLCGCGDDDEGNIEVVDRVDQTYQAYYLSSDYSGLVSENHKFKSSSKKDLVEECITLLTTPSNEIDKINPVHGKLKLLDYEYFEDDSHIVLNFNDYFNQMTGTQSVLSKAAIVKTLTQFNGTVDYVFIKINGEMLKDAAGRNIVLMYSDFVDNTMADIDNLNVDVFKLYFAVSDGTQLSPVDYSIHYNKNISKERVIVESLISGPITSTLNGVINPDTKINDIYLDGSTCIVDLNQTFLSIYNDINFKLTVYSIVDSLCELDYISSVKILINGNETSIKIDDVSLQKTFKYEEVFVNKPIITSPEVNSVGAGE